MVEKPWEEVGAYDLRPIVTPARAEQVRKAAIGHGEVVFDQAGTMDSFSIHNAFQSAARVAADVLVLDIDAAPGPDLVAAARCYCIARPHVRIIVLAPAREPGDPTPGEQATTAWRCSSSTREGWRQYTPTSPGLQSKGARWSRPVRLSGM